MTDEMNEKIFAAIIKAERNDAILVQLDPFAIEVFKDYWSNDKGPFDAGCYISIPCKTEMFNSGGLTTTISYEKSSITRLVHHGEYLGDGRFGRDLINSIREKSLHCRMEFVDNDFIPGCHEEPQGSRWVKGSCSDGCRVVTLLYWSKI